MRGLGQTTDKMGRLRPLAAWGEAGHRGYWAWGEVAVRVLNRQVRGPEGEGEQDSMGGMGEGKMTK